MCCCRYCSSGHDCAIDGGELRVAGCVRVEARKVSLRCEHPRMARMSDRSLFERWWQRTVGALVLSSERL